MAALVEWMRRAEPAGQRWERSEWERRHRAILAVLVLQVPILLAVAQRFSDGLGRTGALVLPLLAAAAVGAVPRWSRRVRAAATTLGLMGTSAVLVYVLDGMIEAHFHFFVMLFVIVLYQDWLTFLLAGLFVLSEHALVGVVAPHMVYSHTDAQQHPIRWAGIHALFIAGAAVAAVANWRMTETAQRESRTAQQNLTRQADLDQLTGLLNRQGFERAVGAALAAGREGAVCVVNIDRFSVLDQATGDQVLRQMSALLGTAGAPGSVPARLTADRFALLLADGPAAAHDRAETLRQAVADHRFGADAQPVALTASIGVAPLTPLAADADDVIQAAEAACLAARDTGRNRVHAYRPDDEAPRRYRQEMHWAREVMAALRENRFELYYQPIVPILEGCRPGRFGEILLRMRGADGEPILPGLFFPAAARFDLLTAIDRWVVARTFQKLAVQHPGGGDHLYSINLSGPTIGDAGFLAHVREQARASGLRPELVCFEITESVAIDDLAAAARFVAQLRSMGFRFALDDFGTGLSSFAYLKNLPVDILKIDGNFVRGLGSNPVDSVMVAAINDLGHQMGLRTVAEFVEDDAGLRRLGAIGVDYGQGYHLGRPEPLAAWFRRTAVVPAGSPAGP